MTSSTQVDLDEVRSMFSGWAVFRSDEGAFYATRRGVILSSEQLKMGIHKTVAAEELSTLVEILNEQARLNDPVGEAAQGAEGSLKEDTAMLLRPFRLDWPR